MKKEIEKIVEEVLEMNNIKDEIDLRYYGMNSKLLLLILARIEGKLNIQFDISGINYREIKCINDFVEIYNTTKKG